MSKIHDNSSADEMEGQIEKISYKPSDKFIIGCRALAGVPVDEISRESGMSREYIYQQKEKVEAYAKSLDEPAAAGKTIEISRAFIIRLILVLTLYCRSSLEGVKRAAEVLFGINVSIGHISLVINEAAKRAQAFDDSIRLDGIKQGANDEIFQGGTPVLTGVDPLSSYAYLLEEASDRTGTTWEIYMQDRKDRGLELDVSINDGGAGLISGISKVYPHVEFQRDVFHAMYEMGKEVSKLERKVYSSIREEYELKIRVDGKRAKEITIEKYNSIIPKTQELIMVYDRINILYTWLKELLGFSGYNIDDTTTLFEYILTEMEKNLEDFPGLKKECEKVRKCLPSLLSYINRLTSEMEKSALALQVPVHAFHLMYQHLTLDMANRSCQDLAYQTYWNIECQLSIMLMEKYDETRCEFQKLLKNVKKASSLVENLNGRIRDYMDIKRTIPTRFFVLLKVYFNTKPYRRSRCPERVGKSPLELLTGKPHPEFLEILGF